MLKDRIIEISDDLDRYKDITRARLFTRCVDNKLKNTLQNYISDLDLTSDELMRKASFRVMKAITKIQKNDDKNAIKEQIKGDCDQCRI